MTKQMPEEISREDQMKELFEKLQGHQVFGRLRGKMDLQTGSVLQRFAKQSKSPTQAIKAWQEFSGDAQVMLNLLAVFERDNMPLASEELWRALMNPGYMIPGETVPLEKTRAISFLMHEPEKTMLIIKWLLNATEYDLVLWREYNESKKSEADCIAESCTFGLLLEFFQVFSELTKWLKDYNGFGKVYGCRADGFIRSLLRAYHQSSQTSHQFNNHIHLLKYERSGIRELEITERQFGKFYESIGLQGFLLSTPNTQKEVLTWYDRKIQADLAVWQVNLPEMVTANNHSDYKVVIVEEQVYNDLKKEWPTFCSHSASHGWGLIVIPGNHKELAERVIPFSLCKSEESFGYCTLSEKEKFGHDRATRKLETACAFEGLYLS